jgi:hypothetical protein
MAAPTSLPVKLTEIIQVNYFLFVRTNPSLSSSLRWELMQITSDLQM